MECLRQVSTRIREAGLKIKPSKSELFRRKVRFLGHVVSDAGLSCNPTKIEAVREYKLPTDVHNVRSFLGFVGYYRRFIKGFATVAAPLTKLLQKGREFRWGSEQQEAFDLLRAPLMEEPLMAYPDPTKEYILDTDASGHGIGGVLSQMHEDGREHVIAYASYSLRETQRNYCTTKRELLAVVAMIHHFRHYLWGVHFRLRTDHASLKWLLNFKDAEGMIARWSARIASYDFDIEIREGRKHGNADGMSRCRQCKREECPADGKKDLVKEYFADEDILPEISGEEWEPCYPVFTAEEENRNVTPVLKSRKRKRDPEPPDEESEDYLVQVTEDEMRELQMKDLDIQIMIQWKRSLEERPEWKQIRQKSATVKALWQQWDQICFIRGLLMRAKDHPNSPHPQTQIVLPLKLQTDLLKQVHNHISAAHMGVTRTLERLKMKFY